MAASHDAPLDHIFDALMATVSVFDVSCCDDDDLEALVRGARSAQRVLDGLITRIAAVAHEREFGGVGRGATGVLLADGRAVSGRTARREAARARVVAELDLVGSAVASGLIGAAQVDVFARAAGDLDPEQRDALNDPTLIEAASSEPVDVFARRMRRAVELIRGDQGLDAAMAERAASSWRTWFDDRTGMGHVHGTFDPERHEAITGAVESHLARLANDGDGRKNVQLAATAAFELLTGAASARSGRPHIGVVVDWQTFSHGSHESSLRETVGGRPLAPESIARLACDAVVQRVVNDDQGIPINVGRRHRTATDAQWLAVKAVHRTCARSGCDRPLAWCQLHHVHEWKHGGATDLCNLVPLCGAHHHAVHEGRWSLRLRDDRRLSVHRPDGSFWASSMPDRVDGSDRSATSRPRTGSRVVAATWRSQRHEPSQPGGP